MTYDVAVMPRGGKRPNSGRPRISDEPTVQLVVQLPQSHADALKKSGASPTVRKLVARWYKRSQKMVD
jgi:hypothetical protein